MRGRFAALMVLLGPAGARAADLDLDLNRYAEVARMGQNFCPVPLVAGACPVKPIACGRPTCVVADNQKFYSLASEMGIVMAPPILSPSETLGYAGFAIGATFGFTTISTGEDYWQAAESYDFDGNDISQGETADSSKPSGVAKLIGATVRKGLWLPVPSFELGLGFRHLLDSGLFALQTDAKISLHEGFHNWPLPEIAVRGSAARAMGETSFDITTAGVDFSMSKQFGILGTVNLTPYFGYQILWIIADPEVIDATPGVDPVQAEIDKGADPTGTAVCQNPDCNSNFVFFDPDPIMRKRIFFGMRLNFDPGSLTGEYAHAFAGDSTDQFVDQYTGEVRRVTDEAASQHSFAIQVGLDF